MGQRKVKQYRRVAEKVAKAQAFTLAQAQILEIIKQPFRMRLRFCWGILFPRRKHRKASQESVIATAHGIDAGKDAARRAEEKHASRQ